MISPGELSHVTLIDLDAISVTCRLEAGSTTVDKMQDRYYYTGFTDEIIGFMFSRLWVNIDNIPYQDSPISKPIPSLTFFSTDK